MQDSAYRSCQADADDTTVDFQTCLIIVLAVTDFSHFFGFLPPFSAPLPQGLPPEGSRA